MKLDWVSDELGVLLDDFLDLFFLNVLGLVFLEEEFDSSTTANRWAVVDLDGKGATSCRFPNILFIVVMLKQYLS